MMNINGIPGVSQIINTLRNDEAIESEYVVDVKGVDGWIRASVDFESMSKDEAKSLAEYIYTDSNPSPFVTGISPGQVRVIPKAESDVIDKDYSECKCYRVTINRGRTKFRSSL